MSVRRRNIQNRIAHGLEMERGLHQQTKSFLKASQDLSRRAIDERDEARRTRDRLVDLASELARYFASDPPAPLSRESDLFLLLQEVMPQVVPSLPAPPPTPTEVLLAVIEAVDPEAAALSGIDPIAELVSTHFGDR